MVFELNFLERPRRRSIEVTLEIEDNPIIEEIIKKYPEISQWTPENNFGISDFTQRIGKGGNGKVYRILGSKEDLVVKESAIGGDLRKLYEKIDVYKRIIHLPYVLPAQKILLRELSPMDAMGNSDSREMIFEIFELCQPYSLPQTQLLFLSQIFKIGYSLQELHKKEVAHLDVKLVNFLMKNREGRLIPCLSDFGEARLIRNSNLNDTDILSSSFNVIIESPLVETWYKLCNIPKQSMKNELRQFLKTCLGSSLYFDYDVLMFSCEFHTASLKNSIYQELIPFNDGYLTISQIMESLAKNAFSKLTRNLTKAIQNKLVNFIEFSQKLNSNRKEQLKLPNGQTIESLDSLLSILSLILPRTYQNL